MSAGEREAAYGALLNELLEAERAGARLLAAYADELPAGSDLHQTFRAVQADEARNCALLIHLLLDAGVAPSMVTGDFYRKGLAVRGTAERIAFLNRGQAWVARRIAATLPGMASPEGRRVLQAMQESHLANIAACERLAA